jgi:hypothetical protein
MVVFKALVGFKAFATCVEPISSVKKLRDVRLIHTQKITGERAVGGGVAVLYAPIARG